MTGILLSTLALIFTLDRSTGAAPVQHLYYLPIVLAGIWFGVRGSLLVASTAVVLYHLANPILLESSYKDTDLVQIALFILIGLGTARLASDARRLHALAMTDDLTGLHNLRSFERALTEMIRASRRTGERVSLLVLDVDRLKALNDTYGHLAGAEAVQTVGRLMAERLPAVACACRYGGDEFVVALPSHTREEARIVAENFRVALQDLSPTLAGVRFPPATLSVSIGVASLSTSDRLLTRSADDAAEGEALFQAADNALYEAKRTGRNRVTGQRVGARILPTP